MKEVWSHFSLQAHCIHCKVEISIHSGVFSVLFTHLKFEHNIILEEPDEEQRNTNLEQALKEEVIEGDDDNVDFDDYDPYEDAVDKVSRPIGIQILKEEDENGIEYKEEIHFTGDKCDKNDESSEIEAKTHSEKDDNSRTTDKFERNFSTFFKKFDYFDEDEDEESLICKFCQEEFPETTLHPKNRLRKLKRHLLNMHQDKLPSSVADLLTSQLEHDAELRRDYKRKNREEEKEKQKYEEGEIFDKFDHFDLNTEDETNSDTTWMVCKYCKERFKNNELYRYNEIIRLRRHIMLNHKEKLSPALAELLTSRKEKERQTKLKWAQLNRDRIRLKKAEYKVKNREKIRKQKLEKDWVVHPETGKVVNIRTIAQNKKRQNHKCPYEGCTQDAVSEWGLQSHIRAKHTGEKPFICNECGRSFVGNGQLQRHLRSHSDEANYQCKYCDKRYKNPNGVIKHQKEGRGCEGLKRMQAMGYSIPETPGESKFYIKLNS